jgi:hypothetical protein
MMQMLMNNAEDQRLLLFAKFASDWLGFLQPFYTGTFANVMYDKRRKVEFMCHSTRDLNPDIVEELLSNIYDSTSTRCRRQSLLQLGRMVKCLDTTTATPEWEFHFIQAFTCSLGGKKYSLSPLCIQKPLPSNNAHTITDAELFTLEYCMAHMATLPRDAETRRFMWEATAVTFGKTDVLRGICADVVDGFLVNIYTSNDYQRKLDSILAMAH